MLSLIGLLALPLQTALAAPRGTEASATIAPLLSVVSTGQTAAFDATITNAGGATIANLRFDGHLTAGALLRASTPCTSDGQAIGCALPNLDGGASFTIRFLVTAPGEAGSLGLDGAFSAEGRRSNPGASQDAWPAAASLAVSDRADLFSSWQEAHGTITFPAVRDANRQSTTVSVPPVGFDYPAFVAHNDDAIVCGASPIEGVGRTVSLSVAGGQSPVALTIAYDRNEVRGMAPANIGVVHQLDNGSCEFPPRGCDASPGFCYDAAWSGSGANRQLVLHVELPSNGRVKGV